MRNAPNNATPARRTEAARIETEFVCFTSPAPPLHLLVAGEAEDEVAVAQPEAVAAAGGQALVEKLGPRLQTEPRVGLQQQVEAEKAVARDRTAVDQKAAAELQAERAGIAKEIPPATYQQYERVRKGRRGIAVAEVVDGRCTACYILLRPQYFQDVKRTESILFCESCQRILYYNPPQAFDDLAGEGGTRVEMGD